MSKIMDGDKNTRVAVLQEETSLAAKSVLPLATNYLDAATAKATRIAYQSDVRQFIQCGGMLPTTIEQVIRYLQDEAPRLSPRTLSRRLTALSHWHTYQGMSDPTNHPLVNKTLKGIMNTYGKPAIKAPALTLIHLEIIMNALKLDTTLSALRDSALLQVGFFGAFRRSELAAIQVEQLNFVTEGVEIILPRSKTDQEGEGRIIALPYGNTVLCPVTALQAWLHAATITSGAVFRGISKSEHVKGTGLTPGSISYLIKHVLQACGIDKALDFSGHSLRRGFATEASRKALSLSDIMKHGRWKSEKTVLGYIEEGQRFTDNAVKKLLQGSDSNKRDEEKDASCSTK